MSNDILEKAKGEGSRGGKIIGHTKSGKPIYESANLHDYNFSRKEHDEAAGIHRAKAKELYEKAGKISGYHTKEEVKKQAKHHSEQADLHEQYYVKDKEKQSEVEKALTTLSIAHLQGSIDDDTIEKARSQADELSKGGEGSRGGKVIGHTKSGKPIYDHPSHESYKNFSSEEHKEAAQKHRELMDKHNKAGEGHLYHLHMAHRDQHEAIAKQKEGKEVEHEHNLKEGDQVREAGGKLGRVIEIRGNSVRTSESGQDFIHITKLFKPSGEAVVGEKKEKKDSKEGKHISDMKYSKKLAWAKELGIKKPESLSLKELNNQIILYQSCLLVINEDVAENERRP